MSEMSDEDARVALGALAGELAELLRLEHDMGAIGLLSVPRATGVGPVGSVAAVGAVELSGRAKAPEPTPAARPPASPRSSAPVSASEAAAAAAAAVADVDALLAQARRARAAVAPREPAAIPPASMPPATPATARTTTASVPAAPMPSASPLAAAGAARASDGRLTVLRELAERAASCTACKLHETRTRSVFSRGSADAEIVFVGEGPGANEDKQGEPFVGAAGQLLDKMVGAIGLARDAVYVCNVVKCRPPENRTPLPDEAAACAGFLDGQLAALRPRVIVALGRCAAERLGCAETGRSWRGTWGEYQGVPVMPTYHPAYLLRNAEMKRPVWEDLQKVMQRVGLAAKSGGVE